LATARSYTSSSWGEVGLRPGDRTFGLTPSVGRIHSELQLSQFRIAPSLGD